MIAISIIITVYNGERYLNAAIQSILHQTIENYEIIIIDDGSTDGTKSLIESIDDHRIKSFFLERTGRAHALNEGINHAQAPLIAFMDADDIALPDRLEKQHHFLQNNPNIGIVSSWYQLIDTNGHQMKIIRKLPEHHTKIEYEMTIHCSMCFPATMMRRELLNKVGGFDTSLQSAVDYDLFLRLLPITGMYNIQEILLYHRIQFSSISGSRSIEQRTHTLRISNNFLKYRLERTPSIHEKRRIYFRLGLAEYYNGTMRNARQWFLRALPELWTQWLIWRYLLATFLGDRLFIMYRKHIKNVYTGLVYND